MSTYALVHGACHGAWCWVRLTPELTGRGHRVVAVDLPTEDRSAGNVRYAEIVAESLSGLDYDVVVVGHSLAGLTIPLVAALRPVRRLVFLRAFPAQPGRSFSSQQHPEGLLPWVEGIASSPAYDADGATFSFSPPSRPRCCTRTAARRIGTGPRLACAARRPLLARKCARWTPGRPYRRPNTCLHAMIERSIPHGRDG